MRDHALFIAFSPADDPKIAVAVIAEHGGHGASFAGPIARQVMDQYLLGYVLYGNEKATEKSSRVTPSMVPGLPTAENPSVAKPAPDRKSVVEGKSVSVREDLGGGRYIKKKKNKKT